MSCQLKENLQLFQVMSGEMREQKIELAFYYYVVMETVEQRINEHKLNESGKAEVRQVIRLILNLQT